MTSDEWTCQTCFKGFARKGDLTRHANIHMGYKPHKCNDCGKSFSQFSGLKTHRNVHTKVKPFLCGMDDCKAAFGDPSSRARHCKETHRTLGAYRCPVPRCKSSIKRRSAFTQHLRKHNIDPETVDIDALAPTLLSRQAFPRRKSTTQHPSQEPSHQSISATDLSFNNISAHPYDAEATGAVYFHIPQLTEERAMTYDWFRTQPINVPTFPAAGLYTIDTASPLRTSAIRPLLPPLHPIMVFCRHPTIQEGSHRIHRPPLQLPHPPLSRRLLSYFSLSRHMQHMVSRNLQPNGSSKRPSLGQSLSPFKACNCD
ncbi:hypothetical protein FPV67DRAFT_425875 [Lyophyllum atratum]|nr:hypothetical protein FPV67DRAFT_425875 [Lyophyllum atratum]